MKQYSISKKSASTFLVVFLSVLLGWISALASEQVPEHHIDVRATACHQTDGSFAVHWAAKTWDYNAPGGLNPDVLVEKSTRRWRVGDRCTWRIHRHNHAKAGNFWHFPDRKRHSLAHDSRYGDGGMGQWACGRTIQRMGGCAPGLPSDTDRNTDRQTNQIIHANPHAHCNSDRHGHIYSNSHRDKSRN